MVKLLNPGMNMEGGFNKLLTDICNYINVRFESLTSPPISCFQSFDFRLWPQSRSDLLHYGDGDIKTLVAHFSKVLPDETSTDALEGLCKTTCLITLMFHILFLFLLFTSDPEFCLLLDSSEGDEDNSGASDDEAGAAGPPGQFTMIINFYNNNIKVFLCIILYIFYPNVKIIIFVLYSIFLFSPPPAAVPGPGPEADPAAARHEYNFTFHVWNNDVMW